MSLQWLNGLMFTIILLGVFSCSRNNKASGSADQYTCPMHPTVLSPTQGACPVCGMDLVRKAREGEELKITEDIARLLPSPGESIVSEMATVKGTYRSIPIEVEAQGIVTYDTRYVQAIPARVGGRLERVYLRYALQPVKRGQRIADIYSPEMLTAQRELLFLSANDPGNEGLMKAAREKLLLLGATPSQVDEWMRTRTVQPVFTVYSPDNGYVIDTQAAMPSPTTEAATPTGDGMGEPAMAGSAPSTGRLVGAAPSDLVREGDYVARGQTLFTVASRAAMRIEVNIPALQAGQIRLGDVAAIDVGSGRQLSARVDLVQPFYSEGEPFRKVRMFVPGESLQIGQLVLARFRSESAESFWLPREAVYDLGTTQIVFVKERNLFKPRAIVAGTRSDGWIEIRSGLASSEEVASQAAYLVDSEGLIKYRSTR